MTELKIPTPLRPYAEGRDRFQVEGITVAEALHELVEAYPGLRPHLFTEDGHLRAFVNVFLNQENVRDLDGFDTAIAEGDSLMILPSIAGGADDLQAVDHAALRTNQAAIIGLSLAAFILDLPWLAGLVAAMMLAATLLGRPAFGFIFRIWLRPRGWVQPDVLADNPEPHRFAQAFGGMVQALGAALLAFGNPFGWALIWVVIALASLNLFGGFCVGCAMYYWLERLRVPGFVKAPPPGILPGARPKAG